MEQGQGAGRSVRLWPLFRHQCGPRPVLVGEGTSQLAHQRLAEKSHLNRPQIPRWRRFPREMRFAAASAELGVSARPQRKKKGGKDLPSQLCRHQPNDTQTRGNAEPIPEAQSIAESNLRGREAQQPSRSIGRRCAIPSVTSQAPSSLTSQSRFTLHRIGRRSNHSSLVHRVARPIHNAVLCKKTKFRLGFQAASICEAVEVLVVSNAVCFGRADATEV